MKTCMKCNKELNDDIMICPECSNSEFQQITKKEVHTDKSKNDMYAWIMALIPLVGMIIGIMLDFGYACLVLNIIFGYIDEESLKKQGVDTSELGGLTFLVPYYLYKRAKLLGDSMSYFIVWCVLFALTLFV